MRTERKIKGQRVETGEGNQYGISPLPTLEYGEKMPKQVMFIIFIAVIILAGFLAYTQVQLLR